MDVDYSPTGREFVTGSYDRTVKFSPSLISDIQYCLYLKKIVNLTNLQVRIFNHNGDHSREIYHTKRMQRFSLPLTRYVSYLLQSIFSLGLLQFYHFHLLAAFSNALNKNKHWEGREEQCSSLSLLPFDFEL